ncbi:MAG: ribosome biogenesis factor YjgA [Tahibacter sp.]
MREHDEELDDDTDDAPSRSEKRREALAVFELAERLVALSDAQLAHLTISEELLDEVNRARRITQQIARKRQVQFLAKQMRRREEELPGLRAAVDHDRSLSRRDAAELHRIEAWRDKLIEQGDEALSELLLQFPQADRQHLRQLARQAIVERNANRPPHAFRELFRVLRELIEDPGIDNDDA